MALQSLVRWLLPKEDHFYDYLEQQAAVGHDAVITLGRFRSGPLQEIREEVQKLEHQGDALFRKMEEALAKTFVTPIDREDLHQLSVELDDVLDLTNLTARSCALFDIDRPSPAMCALVDKLGECTATLHAAMPKLRQHAYADLIEAVRILKRFEKEGDEIFREAIRVLFRDPAIDAKALLREKELLEHVENAIDHCDRVGKTLTNLAVKNG